VPIRLFKFKNIGVKFAMKIKRLLVAISMCLVGLSPALNAQGTNDFAPSGNAPSVAPNPAIPSADMSNSNSASVGGVRHGGGRRHSGGRRGHRRGGKNGMRGGNLSAEQVEARRQKVLAKFDSNHDGVIDQTERDRIKAMRRDRRQANGGQGGGGARNRQGRKRGTNNSAINSTNAVRTADTSFAPTQPPINELTGQPSTIPADAFSYMKKNKNGAGNSVTKAEKRQKRIQRFDTNGDGMLDQNESAAMESAIQQRRAAKAGLPQQTAK
jgi:hypothetical protein